MKQAISTPYRNAKKQPGMALLMVLLLLSLSLGLSYAAMRSMSTAAMIQRNADRRAAARQAAITGLNLALKKMHRNDWAGVDTSLSGTLGTGESYLVTYTSGDPRINSGDAKQPYRVTLLSTGYAADPNQPSSIALYRVRAVVELIPRLLAGAQAWKTTWDDLTSYTVYQWTSGYFSMNVPGRIEGNARIQTYFGLYLDSDYDWSGNPRNTFHSGLEGIRQAGGGDYRPFSGRVDYATRFFTVYDGISVLGDMNIPRLSRATNTVSGMTFPSSLSSYRLYPGGKLYSVPQLAGAIQAAVYQPDAATNPAGLFFRAGSLDLNSDAVIRGTLVTTSGSGRVNIRGKRVRLEAVGLPPLQGTSDPVQLPVAVVGENMQVATGAEVSIFGLVAAYSDFQVVSDKQDKILLTHEGKLIAQNIYIDGRSDWVKTSSWWNSRYNEFKAQESAPNGIKYFPAWLKQYHGLEPSPQITIKPAATPIRYHWHNPQNTIYVAHPDDGGLRWELVVWTENL